ncbi:MAG: LLM class flavin-dependent oxidoreductase, partial [Rhodospirillales bacterium]|nr:LLM class flavin-dependent oxidoreductase [Rhodospirillales bacterium]
LQNGLPAIRNLRSGLEAAAETVGRNLADTRISFLRCAYASDDQREIDSYLDNARFQRRLSETLKSRREHTDDSYLIKEEPSPNDQSFEELKANLPVGSVNRVIDRMLEEIEALKPTQVMIQTQLGDFDQTTMLKQIELWGSRILPALRKAVGSATPAKVTEPA